MPEALDDLPGGCPRCGSGPFFIDTAGAGEPHYWAYCDNCEGCCCSAPTADGVAQRWERLRTRLALHCAGRSP